VARDDSESLKTGAVSGWRGCTGIFRATLAARTRDIKGDERRVPVFWLTGEPYRCTVWPTMSDPRQLTPRQKEVLEYIQDETDDRQRPPTVREIGAYLAVSSPGTITDHLAALENGGWIERGRGKARSIRLLKRLDQMPLVGEVTAGVPLQAEEQYMGFITPAGLFGTGEIFAVGVRGDSMVGCGILDGDYAIVRKQAEVETGEIALAVLNGEQTIKRLIKTEQGFRLQPENPVFKPIEIVAGTGDFRVAGKVVGIMRKLGSR
jgi:repressor LexA